MDLGDLGPEAPAESLPRASLPPRGPTEQASPVASPTKTAATTSPGKNLVKNLVDLFNARGQTPEREGLARTNDMK